MLKGRIQLTYHANILPYSEVSSRRPASARTSRPSSGAPRQRERVRAMAALEEEDEGQDRHSARSSRRGEGGESLKHRLRKAKADRAFDKRYSAPQPGPSEGGPRAALYEGKMGHTHKKSARMQNEAARSASSRAGRKRSSGITARLGAVAAAVVVVALALGFLYPAAKDSYVAMRAQAQLQAEYDALVQRNEAIQANVDRLSTDEGVEDRAREEFGWVKSGENSVNVYGLEEDEGGASNLNADVTAGSVPAPETWYSSILDPLFGVNPETVAKDQ